MPFGNLLNQAISLVLFHPARYYFDCSNSHNFSVAVISRYTVNRIGLLEVTNNYYNDSFALNYLHNLRRVQIKIRL